MTTLVTGSAGHLGEALMRTLRASGRPAVGLDVAASPYTSITGSIVDRDIVRDALRGVRHVIHTATLHKPHLATHSAEQFIETNVRGTMALLEEAVAAGVESFVFTSTTSAFGSALSPPSGAPAAWITEEVIPVPRNIYGTSKVAAESLCEMVHRQHGLPVVVLRTSRFFPEPDDDPRKRAELSLANAQVLELLHRRADIEDVVSAHLAAIERATSIGFGRFIISATTPFSRDDVGTLRADFGLAIDRRFPRARAIFAQRGWRIPTSIDRVYVNDAARATLGWTPTYDFARVLDLLAAGEDHRSALARAVGAKGYHVTTYADGIYPVRQDQRSPV